MKNLLENAREYLQTLAVEQELKAALQEVLDAILQDPARLEKVRQMYQHFFDREEPLGREIAENANDISEGMLCAAIFFARGVLLRQENRYELPEGSPDSLDQILSYMRKSKNAHGKYALLSTIRFWAYAYAYPCIFRLGRLEYEMGRFSYSYTVFAENGKRHALVTNTIKEENGTVTGCLYNEDGLEPGEYVTLQNPVCLLKHKDRALNVHVPGEGKLTEESVQASLDYAVEFFKKYFPQIAYKAFVCSSWLLNPGLKQFLGETSNILKFQNRFHIPFKRFNDFSLFSNIFQVSTCPLEELVPTNRFQKEVLDFVKAGGKLYSGQGYILIER